MNKSGEKHSIGRKRGTIPIVAIALAGALLAFTPGAAAHESEVHGVITVHDEEDGPQAGERGEVHCEFWVRGHGMDGPEGQVVAALFLGGPSAHAEDLANWTGDENDNGTFDFEAGPFSFDKGQDIFDLSVFAQVGDEDSNHTSPWVPMDYRQCPPPSECPPDATLAATANEDGSVTVEAEGLDGEAELWRAIAGTDDAMHMATLDAENSTFHDATTEVSIAYEYRLVVDGETCTTVEVTAIPFFPGPLVVLAMVGATVVVHLAHRRRR